AELNPGVMERVSPRRGTEARERGDCAGVAGHHGCREVDERVPVSLDRRSVDLRRTDVHELLRKRPRRSSAPSLRAVACTVLPCPPGNALLRHTAARDPPLAAEP